MVRSDIELLNAAVPPATEGTSLKNENRAAKAYYPRGSIYTTYGVRHQKTIPILVLGT